MSKLMRMLVMFDLPVGTPEQRRNASRFRNFLQKDGYSMVQFSVYARLCAGFDAVEKHKNRLRENMPPNGSIRVILITEKQYAGTEIMLGDFSPADDPVLLVLSIVLRKFILNRLGCPTPDRASAVKGAAHLPCP